jgi:hypothetical protein
MPARPGRAARGQYAATLAFLSIRARPAGGRDAIARPALPGGWLWGYTWQRMAWRFRKSLKLGPVRLNLSKSGVGYSIGGRGFRVGKDAKGRSYTAASIPGTGLYSRMYSGHGKTAGEGAAAVPGAPPGRSNGVALALGMLALAFMAGGLVVFLLMPSPNPPPVAPPAAVSAPVAPAQPIPANRRRVRELKSGKNTAQMPQHSASGTPELAK